VVLRELESAESIIVQQRGEIKGTLRIGTSIAFGQQVIAPLLKLKDRKAWLGERKKTMLRRTHFDEVPVKPQRMYEEMNKVFGKETCDVSTIGLSQIAAAQFLHVFKPRHWINCRQAGPLGWSVPAALGVRTADPEREIVAISGRSF
jgi:glyoxylate carboligase